MKPSTYAQQHPLKWREAFTAMNRITLFCVWTLIIAGTLSPATASAGETVEMTVAEAVTEALAHNPAMQEAEENLAAAREGIKSARADRLPQLSLGYGYTALKETPIMKTAGDAQVAHQRSYDWNLTVVQPLFTGFALNAQHQIARLDTTTRELEIKQAHLDIIRNTRSACYNLLLTRKLLLVSEDEVKTLTAHKAEAEHFHNQGLTPLNDQLRAEVALSNAIQNRENVRANVQKAILSINRLLNRPLASELTISEETGLDMDMGANAKAFDLAALNARATEQRPILKLLDVSMEKLGFAKKAARSDWYPHISLMGGLAHSGDNPAANQNDYSDDDESYVAVTLNWKFWRSGKTLAEVNRTRRQIKALEARIDGYQTQVQEEVRSALLDCKVAFANIDTASRALDQARENWRITDIQYQNQAATSTEVLDARSFLTQADTNYYRSVYGYLNARAGLEWATGEKSLL